MKKKILILTGAGISRESGILTFRDCEDGLWNDYKIEDVCTTQAWKDNREEVLEFYNARRKDLEDKVPNDGHKALVELEKYYDVTIVTQNVDDLHEQAGSTNVIHLHGELTKSRSTVPPYETYDIGYGEINIGDKCPRGSQIRPHVVFFGDPVPNMQEAMIVEYDILVVIGTSLQVYPAAGLVDYAFQDGKEVYAIDPVRPVGSLVDDDKFIKKPATEGCKELLDILTPCPTAKEIIKKKNETED